MKFHNPWIDPRIVQMTPEAAQAYLESHGWKLIGPAANPLFFMYDGPGVGENIPSVLVPLKLDDGPLLGRMVEFVAEVAKFENRWAVQVLTDMLRQPTALVPVMGPGVSAPTEPVSR